MIPQYNQGVSSYPGSTPINSQKIGVPVAAFPLRGRCNPYCSYLIPLVLLRILIFLSLVGALISAIVIPKNTDDYNNQVPHRFMSTRVGAICIYAIAAGVSSMVFLVEVLNCFNTFDSRCTSIFINVVDLYFSLATLGISVPMIVREEQLDNNLFTTAVDEFTFRAAGILGMCAVLFYMLHLFLSRFYQLGINNYKNFKREFIADAGLFVPKSSDFNGFY